mgnify:CR=1 FL=1
MRILPFLLLSKVCLAGQVHQFWSFQDNQNPGSLLENNGRTVGRATVSTWLNYGNPEQFHFGQASGILSDGLGAGGSTFTAFDGSVWMGSGNATYPGNCVAFSYVGPEDPGNPVKPYFYVVLDTRNVVDLKIRFDIRSAQNGSAQRLTSFSSIRYRTETGEGVTFSPIVANLDFPGASGVFAPYAIDLSHVDGIENQAFLEIRFNFPRVPENTSVRVDNLQISGTQTTAFSDWAGRNSVSGGPTGMPFNDGITNLEKYAFNISPLVSSQGEARHMMPGVGKGGLPAHDVQQTGEDRRLLLEFVRRKTAPDLTYLPRFSNDFSNWSILPESLTVTSIDDDWERVVAQSPISRSRIFGKVTVSTSEEP